ncbi:AAA family ATPase [Clostridium gasigenes]|uniref:AAA family ATPase n=1 Tax=Clostridium gasigenes TaxID=94869 RepID=UPI0016264C4B|nr:AAA family ATPase [Clostridium gasigenes]MBB6624271.1 AAA family ATPase [Clostridium gasigenes]
MKRELTPKEVIFKIICNEAEEKKERIIPEIQDSYKRVGRALSIEKDGFNLYVIDSFSKNKLKELIKYIKEQYEKLEPPKDICYVVVEDAKKPEAIFVENGKGKQLKETVESLKTKYLEFAEDFYNSSSNEKKDKLIDEIESKRTKYINELMDMAKVEGFDVKASAKGFAFIPINNGEALTEEQYDDLDKEKKESISLKAASLKKKAEGILDTLKEIEVRYIKKLKNIYSKFLIVEMEEYKDNALLEFVNDDESYEYLERLFIEIEKEVVNTYTMSIEDDEAGLYEIINKYAVKILVDNSINLSPVVIYEEDPSINNLMGSVEYENNNGVYTTDISLINSGSMIRANEGCIIIRISSLATSPYSYYYLKKALMANKLSYDTSRVYSEVVSINGLKPKPIPIKLKVILIGDYESYDTLYNADEDFKKLFPLRAEFTDIVEMKDEVVFYLKDYVKNRIKENNIKEIDDDAIMEVLKYLCRRANSKSKINIDDIDIDKLIILTNNYTKERGGETISKEDVTAIAYEEEKVEEEYMKMFKENKILLSLNGKKVGSINALAVLDTGYHSFGKPMRVTCVAYKGTGRIVDIQKESNLSGKIHEKSINILKGLLSSILDPYESMTVDFHLSFEQIYGLIEGDSASVSEMLCILSALSKKPIRQNISVTGSLNQFGEVQPIGGVNEKIEGFYKVCKLVDNVKNKGVLVPNSNKDEIILNSKIEKSIENGDFHIYTMETLNDAIEVMILEDGETIEDFFKTINEELKKYEDKDKDKDKDK